ncbi:hypothetical protein IAR50_002548 [Cryptococcus sp. DSM 104548]
MFPLEGWLLSDPLTAPRESAPHPLVFRFISVVVDAFLKVSSIFLNLALIFIYLLSPVSFPGWTLDRHLRVRTERLRGMLLSRVLPTILYDERRVEEWDSYEKERREGRANVNVLDIRPVDVGRYGCSKRLAEVKAVTRPAFWIRPLDGGKAGNNGADGMVILHLHGGGYIRGHPLWTPFPYNVARATGLSCLSVCYRKALSPSSSFPAPLFDALSAYFYLTETLQHPAPSIVLLGESAGGHLVLMLIQYLSQFGLPQPGYIALSSPWSDWSPDYPSYIENAPYDTVCMSRLRGAISSASRHFKPEALESPWFSPAKAQLGHWEFLKVEGVRVYMQYGAREVMRDEIVALGGGMKRDGVHVRIREDLNGVHTGALTDEGARKVFEKDLVEMLNDESGPGH